MSADPTAVDLRTTLGAVELPRDVVRVAGPDAVDYLQGQLSQDVAALGPGEAAWSFLLQPTGKVDAWLRVTRTGDDELVLDVDARHGEAVVARLRRFLLRRSEEHTSELQSRENIVWRLLLEKNKRQYRRSLR